ncbi:TetR/AcrR family transcriptional regulator [Colwellia sp. PAMC 21821]|uniref:TetR/AcrR family transcriptional regulator n=1 Tax=Colwellia sp. PAMC 21821 TaxID=1816219 RepID=UPI0009C119FF|nr:TetR/AcrR family transcriptional regulator [Colwellia sp. PAMC 21821]
MLLIRFLRADNLPSTTEKILNTAMECFFQHGYDTANISMVSRYAGISRVTIHKQFKSKEVLFRSVLEKHFQQHNILINIYSKSEANFWQETQDLIIQRCEGLFNNVSSSLVRSNLIHAGHAYCKDLIQAEEGLIKNSIRSRIEKEISANRLTLSKVGLTADELAETLHFAPFGITVSVLNQNNIAFVENLMAIFKASTSRSRS